MTRRSDTAYYEAWRAKDSVSVVFADALDQRLLLPQLIAFEEVCRRSPATSGDALGLRGELDRARVALHAALKHATEVARTIADDEELEQAQLWVAFTASTGITRGQTITVSHTEHSPRKTSFLAQTLRLQSERTDWHEVCRVPATLHLVGAKLGKDGVVGSVRCKQTEVVMQSLAKLRDLRGIAPSELSDPREISDDQVVEEVKAALATHHPLLHSDGEFPTRSHVFTSAAERAVALLTRCETENPIKLGKDEAFQPPPHAEDAAMRVGWADDADLRVEWFARPSAASRRANQQDQDRAPRHWAASASEGRLGFQVLEMGKLFKLNDFYGFSEGRLRSQCARMQVLVLRLAVIASSQYVAALRRHWTVQYDTALVLRAQIPDMTGKSFAAPAGSLCLVTRVLNHKKSPHLWIRLTGLGGHALIDDVEPFPWRSPTVAAMQGWAKAVANAGGEDLSTAVLAEDFSTTHAELTDFYRENDPVLIARAKAAAAVTEKSRVVLLEESRTAAVERVAAVIPRLAIGPGTGWDVAVADLAGISPNLVKPWLRKNLPSVFADLFPFGVLLAKVPKK